MICKRLASYICHFICSSCHLRIKNAPSGKTITMQVVLDNVKAVLDSPAGSNSVETPPEVEFAGGDTCCVCLSRVKGGQDVRVLPCLHKFHLVCINRWLSGCQKACPVCRFSLEEENTCKREEQQLLTEEMTIWFSSFHVAGF